MYIKQIADYLYRKNPKLIYTMNIMYNTTIEIKRMGNKMQIHFYISDYNETIILQAGTTVEAFLKLVSQDAVTTAKRNLGDES